MYTGKELNNLSKEIHEIAISKGFWDGNRNFDELFMLIISELGETIEAHRKGKIAIPDDIEAIPDKATESNAFKGLFEAWCKDTMQDEIADVLIRVLDLMGRLKVTLQDLYIIEPVDKINVGEELFFIVKRIVDMRDYLNTPSSKEATNIEMSHLFRKPIESIISFSLRNSIDLPLHVHLKMEYNKLRDKLHGKKY